MYVINMSFNVYVHIHVSICVHVHILGYVKPKLKIEPSNTYGIQSTDLLVTACLAEHFLSVCYTCSEHQIESGEQTVPECTPWSSDN